MLLMGFFRTLLPFPRSISSLKFARNISSATIFGLSSGFGKSGIAVIRISGPKSKYALQLLCTRIPKPRVASVRKLEDPFSKDTLDKAVVLWFPGPNSFTGEDCSELHVHGGPAVVSAVLSSLGKIPGLRPAQAGEFTKQAFQNCKLDLTEVEGLGDLIHAETEAQRRQALRQMEGELGNMYSQWRSRLIKCLANVEAFIDFSEEENIEDGVLDKVLGEVSLIRKELEGHLKDERRGERLRDGLRVVILGEPNVGKSSLLNVICQRPAAIVSPVAGTTRDIVETSLNIAGYPVIFSDTAGLRETQDIIEKEGVIRARNRAESADLKILVLDVPSSNCLLTNASLSDFVRQFMKNFGLTNGADLNLPSNGCEIIKLTENCDITSQDKSQKIQSQSIFSHHIIIVINKIDLKNNSSSWSFEASEDNVCLISCRTGAGLEHFMEVLVDKIKYLCGDPSSGPPSLTQTRHRYHLAKSQDYLSHFLVLLSQDVVLAAEKLRQAAREIGQVTGAVSTEDILQVIFQDFCIGK